MTILARLQHWKDRGTISAEQHAYLASLSRGEPVSLFLELNTLLYAGVLACIAGLSWTVTTWSHQLGDILIVTVLVSVIAACYWYCFSRATPWSPAKTRSPSLIFNYVLYLGSLTWVVALAYIEDRFHLLSGQWDFYLLTTAALFFFLAYRFDNRFVLSLALSSLGGWFGLTISRWPSHQDAAYRGYAILYSMVVGTAGALLQRGGLKPHFFNTYLNIAANVLFWALIFGVFERHNNGIWFIALLIGCGASMAWGLKRRQFNFVAYAAIYGYIGATSIILRDTKDGTLFFGYFVVSGIATLFGLVLIARRFWREP